MRSSQLPGPAVHWPWQRPGSFPTTKKIRPGRQPSPHFRAFPEASARSIHSHHPNASSMSISPSRPSFGMIGLGTMGRNLLLNLADHGFPVSGYDKDATKVALLAKEGQGKPVTG